MADSKTSTHWFISQNTTTPARADREAKEALGENAGLVTVPYFPLPPHGQDFEDTAGRFPLKKLKEFLQSQDDTSTEYWYARVLPEDGNPAKAEYLSLHRIGSLRLRRTFPNVSYRALLTITVSEQPD